MGRIREPDLWRHFHPPQPGEPVPIGKMAASPPEVTATSIARRNGRWRYETEEVPVRVWPNRFLEAPFSEGRLLWMGLEVKTSRRDLLRHDLVFSLEPYSLNWYGHGKFRPAAKSRAAAARAIEKEWAKSGELLRAIESVTHDPFETNTRWFTARVRNPMRLHWWSGEGVQALGDQFAYGRSVNFSYGTKGKESRPHWVFAVCPDFETAAREIRKEMLTDPVFVRDMPLEPSEIVDLTLTASVHQALGGRAGGTREIPVAWAASRIYRGHMEAAAKRSGAAAR